MTVIELRGGCTGGWGGSKYATREQSSLQGCHVICWRAKQGQLLVKTWLAKEWLAVLITEAEPEGSKLVNTKAGQWLRSW